MKTAHQTSKLAQITSIVVDDYAPMMTLYSFDVLSMKMMLAKKSPSMSLRSASECIGIFLLVGVIFDSKNIDD